MKNLTNDRFVSALALTSTILASCLISFAPAEAADALLRDLLRIAPPNASPMPSATPLPSLYGAELPDDEVSKCLIAACGDIKKNSNVDRSLVDRIPPSPHFQKVWDRVLKPAVHEALVSDRESKRQTFKRIQYLLKSGRPVPRNHPAQALIQLMSLSKTHLAKMQEFIAQTNTFGVVRLDEAKIEAYLSSVSDPNERDAVRLLFQMVGKGLKTSTLDPSQNKIAWRLSQLYPSLDRVIALKTDASSLLSRLALLDQRAGGFFGSQILGSYDIAVLKRATKGRDLNNLESKIYLEAAANLETAAAATEGELFETLMKLPYDAAKELKKLKSTNLLSKIIAGLDVADLNRIANAVETACFPPLSIAHNSPLSKDQLKRLEGTIASVRSAAKVVTKHFAETNIGDAGVDRLFEQEISFKLPDNPREAITELHFRLDRENAKKRAFSAKIAAGSPEIDDTLLILAPFLASGEADQQNQADSIINLCSEIQPATISDFTLSAQGKIMLSWHTANYPDAGRGIIAHEIGHVTSQLFRMVEFIQPGKARFFMESLNCVANRNPFVMRPVSLRPESNSTWSEEDWADHFSALVLSEMQKSAKVPFENFACATVSGLMDYRGNRMRPTANDSHSSGLLRVLMIANDLQRMPLQCQAFIDYAPANRRKLTCD